MRALFDRYLGVRMEIIPPCENSRSLKALTNVAEDLLNEVERFFKERGELSDESLLALHSVFGSSVERALDLLDLGCVTFLRIPGGKRSLAQVVGSSGVLYTLFPRINYCQCPSYRYHVVGTGSQITCKHILVARLAEIVGKSRDISLSGKDLSNILCSTANIMYREHLE